MALVGMQPHVQAGAAEPVARFDQRDLESVLRSADGAGIAGRSAANHYYVKDRVCQSYLLFLYPNILEYRSCQVVSGGSRPDR